ncbi:MAG: glycosyltransferase family 2 protein [Clostridium sp.]|nr:glycosyltransferase family 2 protein [Clostridium sp.]
MKSCVSIARQVSLVITTYNSPVFLELVLKSVLHQRVFPLEVIIADDGSTGDTRRLIDRYRDLLPVPLIHSWIPDEGFRVAKSRNEAVAHARGKYIVMIDGDMLLTPHFIADHDSLKEEGWFVAGSRARLTRQATEERCRTMCEKVTIWSAGLKRRLVLLRVPGAWRLIKGHSDLRHARSCHLAFWRSDFVRVNGFEEAFVGWGYEDSEFVQRLFNNGLHRRNAKLMAPAVHLYHPEKSMDQAERNREMLAHTVSSGKKRAEKGVDQYL